MKVPGLDDAVKVIVEGFQTREVGERICQALVEMGFKIKAWDTDTIETEIVMVGDLNILDCDLYPQVDGLHVNKGPRAEINQRIYALAPDVPITVEVEGWERM